MPQIIIDWIWNWHFWEVWLYPLLLNIWIFFSAIFIGNFLIKKFPHQPVSQPTTKITPTEYLSVCVTILINSIITSAGWYLWKNSWMQIDNSLTIKPLIDVIVLFCIMDFMMYWLHRVGHIKWLYPYVHVWHHRQEEPKPLSLFILNPFETSSFGVIWLVLLCFYESSWLGNSIYLTINLLFGLLGHLGVEVLPPTFLKNFLGRWFTTGSFHVQHHQDIEYNYGFYTLFWDKLFQTKAPYYEESFGKRLKK
jgi:sterol desaturase/sphingolipid hydroxylase (fatty acid hydroxylase superfamily)